MNADQQQRLEQLLATKSFDALTAEERALVYGEFGSEEQYELARKVGQALVRDTAGLSPDPWILQSLRERYRHQHAGAWWMRAATAKVPAYAAVLLCLTVVGIAPWTVHFYSDASSQQLSSAPVVHRDTVYLQATADTVYIQRIKYRTRIKIVDRPVYVNVTPTTPSQPGDATESVTMKEKEELEKLLVSGSDK